MSKEIIYSPTAEDRISGADILLLTAIGDVIDEIDNDVLTQNVVRIIGNGGSVFSETVNSLFDHLRKYRPVALFEILDVYGAYTELDEAMTEATLVIGSENQPFTKFKGVLATIFRIK